ncbi:LysR family transcriptional regulator [Roseomonas nepalensis]|uniref:LysR family transcriptional regulator n=1 Tax=Muricoccus nepalensis TaxID=1854500 RepID=A0A502G1P6_9PROT|nr:LysR family transcriptional regulator [Roseomonas nepalensis]
MQPALARQVAELERQLGIGLLDHVGGRLMLTEEGAQLLSDCWALLPCAAELCVAEIGEGARLFRHGDAGELKVASSPQ